MKLEPALGLTGMQDPLTNRSLLQYINLKLAMLGLPTAGTPADTGVDDLLAAVFAHYRETDRVLANYLCAADQRIQNFIYDYLQDVVLPAKLPPKTLVLDRPGMARALSLPVGKDTFTSELVSSFRVQQGVLHNPRSDRRTTQGIFHVAEGGLPIPADKAAVPKAVFATLLRLALHPPAELLRLPFTAGQATPAECFVSLLLRPVVCPGVPGFISQKTMEIRFFAPGTLVSNLDFVESIFGNAGDPFLPENDAGLDTEHWSGHTGCVILAPHLTQLTKFSLGLPNWENATERQRRDGMCWKTEDERYNLGQAFKVTARDESGTIVTVIADNYFGYCKKEVKTQISFAANLFGLCEEEHAGGTLAFPSYDLGEEFLGNVHVRPLDHSFEEVVKLYRPVMDVQPAGYAIDRVYPNILYVPEDARFDLQKQTISWPAAGGGESQIKLLADQTYVRPSGYKVRMYKPPAGRAWRLVGAAGEGTVCHKPCTVSGGGKSEISKSISDAILQGPVFISDFAKDFDWVGELIERDYSDRFLPGRQPNRDSRRILSSERSLGSVIKLLTPSPEEFTAEYNAWLRSIPQYIKELLFTVKRFYKPEWGTHWREPFSVDFINGTPGNELKCDNRKLVASYLRVGFDADGAWRTFGLRKDFQPAAKISLEDDITASVVVPATALTGLNPEYRNRSVKFVHNCEYRLFQRPDDAIHRGYDKQTESDFARPGNFFSNYEPLNQVRAGEIVADAIGFAQFTEPMQSLIRAVAGDGAPGYFVSSAHPRLVGGKPSKNPRYLQVRPDLLAPRDTYLAQMATRLRRRIPLDQPVPLPVNAVLPGHRNNPPERDAGIPALAVFNPIHYLELPELFMEFICSMTGKSPSTTGAGSEGALTKGPFNALAPIIDLNNALVSYLLTGDGVFITAAGCVGPQVRVDHDISLLVPELWCRMSVEERSPEFLIARGYLEKCADFTHAGAPVLASRLGYRITQRFVNAFFGRVFNHPDAVFTEEMLRPEKQDLAIFVEGMETIITTQQRVAQLYFDDGSIAVACPPLRALLHLMRDGKFEGKALDHPEIRALFTREAMLASDWYARRLAAKQAVDLQLCRRNIGALEKFLGKTNYAEEASRLGMADRLSFARLMLERVKSPRYLDELRGTLGANPLP